MVKMAPPRIFVALASMIAVASASYPEFTPGKGMPSLEELGLTSEQLFTTPPPQPSRPEMINTHYTPAAAAPARAPNTSPTSTTWDAALGLQWIFTNCNEGGRVLGYKEVGGGEYLLAATRSTIVFAGPGGDDRPVDLWKGPEK
ncbi:hypothetical protein VE02_08772 [Pseudogymnoascus sp. 03VT05]|nr:hypothetical protein VE02_08772 [Pseudogymnoascus sp. 03VT05]